MVLYSRHLLAEQCAAGSPSPTGPCRPRRGARPCPDAEYGSALRVKVALAERKRLPDAEPAAPEHHNIARRLKPIWIRACRRTTATISSAVGGSAGRLGRACPCCAAPARRESRGASRVSDAARQNRTLTRRSLGSPSIRQRIVALLYQGDRARRERASCRSSAQQSAAAVPVLSPAIAVRLDRWSLAVVCCPPTTPPEGGIRCTPF